MRYVSCVVAAAALAATLSGCADPYYGNRRSYVAAPAYYNYTPSPYYASSRYYSQPSPYYASYPSNTYYGSKYDYYRNYNGSLHPVGQDM